MATLKATRQAQYPLAAEFTFAITDDMVNTSGVDTAFNATSGTVYDVINLPINATVVGGSVTVNVVSNDATTATIAVGDSGTANRYLTATSIKSTGLTALVPTGYVGAGENLRITLANGTGGATTGNVTVRVLFTLQGRGNEAITS